MSDDEGPDSDSSGRELRESVTRTRSRERKEARICYSSRTSTMSLQDPMPEYVDPELVKLIAQNAPFELDVFVHSLRHTNSSKRRVDKKGRRKGRAEKESERGPPLPVEILLSSVRERNDHLSARNKHGQDVRHSCPERMWNDYGQKDEEFICRAKAVKRKRPKGLDGYRLPLADRPSAIEVSLRMSDNKGRSALRGSCPENSVGSGHSSDDSSNFLEEECLSRLRADASEVSLAAAPHSAGNDSDVLNAKPWRHGMRKGTRSAAKDEKPPPPSTCCKRKAEVADSRKTSEVRKYMETKMLERRKEQQQLKAEADAALAARKEQHRKLDLHRQATLQSQASGGKGREHAPRPAWVSEYTSLCEPPRPWSSSSGELNAYLPPPVTPPTLEPVPLDLYATQFQYAGHPSTPRVDVIQLQNAQPREKRRSKRGKVCSREVQRQLKYRKSQIMKEFPHVDVELTKLATSSVTRKTKWKAKTKARGRTLFSEEFFQLQVLGHDEVNLPQRSGDLEVYKRSLQRQSYSNGRSLCKGSGTQNSTSRVPPKTHRKGVQPPENCVISAIRDHGRPLSKVKRLKPTEGFIPCKSNDLTEEELATLLTASRVPSDCESETNAKVNGQVIAKNVMIVRASPPSPAASQHEMITDLRKCVGHSLGSPHKKITTDEEDVLCKWFGPSVECAGTHLIDEDVLQQENSGQMLDNSLKPSRSSLQLQQVLDFQKEKVPDSEIVRAKTRKQTTLAVRWQRMQLLKNLAEQLVKRVNAACAKKRQIESSAVEQIKSPSMDIKLSHSELLAPAGSGHEVDSLEPKLKLDNQPKLCDGLSSIHRGVSIFDYEKSGESELKFLHHHQPKQSNILQCTGLTEQEQAGCETPSVQLLGMELKVQQSSSTSSSPSPSPSRRTSMPEANDHNTPAGGPDSNESCTRMDWNTLDKGTGTTCNNPLACSSFGRSSLSTGSSSPVILPTSSKYHLGRFKHGKKVLNEEKTRYLSKKLDWIVPAENDTHSIFNVYTQHLKNREKLATGTFPHVVQNDLEKMEIDVGIAEPAAQEDMSTIASIPLSQKVTMSELPVKPPEPMSLQIVSPTEGSHESRLSPESVVGTGSDPHRKHLLSSSNFESLQNIVSGADADAVRPPAELNSLKKDAMEPAGISPEVTILEIKDLKLCQSSTSFRLRLDRCKDSREDTKEQKLVDISHMPNVTYARRVHSRAMPDGRCTDERVVVELHQSRPDDTRLGSPELDASDEAPQGLPSSRMNKGVDNAQSGIQEESTVSTVHEYFKKGHVFSKGKGNVALQPIIDHVLDHNKLLASEGETGSPRTMMTCQKGELATQLNYSSKADPLIDLRDFQECELKLRRDQLEAELQKLDAEIMKTRARLHQRHSMIDNQVQCVSSSLEQPVEGSLKLGEPSNIQKRPAKDLTNKERQNVVSERDSDLQKIAATSHSSPNSRRDEAKTATSSNPYSDSFVSEDTEMGQKIVPGTGLCDSHPGHPLSGKTINLCGQSFREPKIVNQQLKLALEDRLLGSPSHVVQKQVEAQSYCETPSTQGDLGSEGSEMSTGRGPGRRLDMPPPQVDSAAAWHTIISKVRLIRPVIPDQLVAVNVGEVQPCAQDDGNIVKSRTGAIGDDELLDASQDSVDTTTDNSSRKGPRTSSHSIQEIEEMVTRDKINCSFQQNARILTERGNSYELPECGARESHSSVFHSASRNTETSNNPMPGGATNGKLAGIDISNGNRIPAASTKQNGWMNGKQQGSVATCDEVEEVLSCPIRSEQDGKTSYTVVPSSTLLLSSGWTTSQNVSGGVPRRELGKESQRNGEEVMVTKKAELLGSCQNAKTLVAAEDSFIIVAAAEELHSMPESDECIIPVVPSRRHSALQQISPSLRENPGQTFSQCNIGPASKVEGPITSMLNGGKVSTCSHEEGRMSDEAAHTIPPQYVDAANLTSERSVPCSSATNEKADWECLSLPSHMDFSTIKEKLRNNKLAVEDFSPFSNGWSSYQDESCKSSSIFDEAGGDSSGVQTVASGRIIPCDVSNNNKNLQHEDPSSVEFEEAAKSTCPPCEMGANKQNGIRRLPSRSENTINSKADPNYKYSDTEGLMMPHVSSAGEQSSFLPSPYFRQETIKSSKASVESTISEDLENYESDIEELQDDAVSSGYTVETTSTWKASSPTTNNNASTSKPDSACCVGVGSPRTKIFHSESGFLRVTNGLTSGTGEVCKSSTSIYNTTNQDLIVVGVPKPCPTACGIGKPATELLSRQFENPLSLLHARDQCKSQTAASCTSPGDADEEVIRTSQTIRAAVNEDDSKLLKIPTNADDYCCGSEVSQGSHLQSESLSEEVQSVDSEATSFYRSGPQRENSVHRVHRVDLVGLNTREESNEDDDDTQKNVDDAGKYYSYNSVVSSSAPPLPPDFIENADRTHYSLGIAGLTKAAGTAVTDNRDINFSFTDCVATAADLQEIARSRDDWHHHALLPLGSHTLTLESSKPIELPMPFKIPQLRTSEDSMQCNDGTHFSPVSIFGKLSCAKDYQVEEILHEDEKHLLENISGMKIESAFDRLLVTETLSNAYPGGSISGPGEIAKTAITALYREPSDPGTMCNLNVARVEGSPILVMQKIVDHLEVSGPTSNQTGPIQEYDSKTLAVDVVFDEGDCHGNSLAEALEETEQLSDETHELSSSFTDADSSSATNYSGGEEDNESAVAVSSRSIYGHSGPKLRKVSCQDKKGLVVSIPLDCGGSKSDPTTFLSEDTLDSSCVDLLTAINENQQPPVEYRIVDVESKRSFNSGHDDHGGPATSAHQMVPADRDLLKTETSYTSQSTCLRPDRIIALKACHANKLRSTSILIGNQHLGIDFDKCTVENQAHDKSYNLRQVNFGSDFTDTTSEFEGHTNNQMNSPVGSLQFLQTHLVPSQHGSITSECPTNCCGGSSSKKGFLSHTPDNIVRRDNLVKEVHKLPRPEDLEECSPDMCSSNVLLLKSAQENMDMDENENEALSRCETQEADVGCAGSKPVSNSDAPDEEQMIPTTCTTAIQEASFCFSTKANAPPNMLGGITQKTRIQVDARRAEKHNIMTDLLTSMIYEDLVCAELSGFYQEVQTASLETSGQMNQTAKVIKAFNPKGKTRSRKVSGFCKVLKHFLPIGWRAASIRHKTGLFLHVEGLRPHPLNPATRAMPGTLKRSVQYPCYGQSERFSETATPQFLFLDSRDLHSCVQRSLEVSNLIPDPMLAKWYNPKKPVVEHVLSASHSFEHSQWQIHDKLISDLINEILLKQFATKLFVPSVGMMSLPLPAGGEDLVQFVTNRILMHDRYASKHGFDIEKVIAKAFEDEHWDKCSEEARDVVGDLAQDILGDLIERFVYEMMRGWCYYINQCHVLAT